MKEVNLSYNLITGTYIYYEGKKKGPQHNRREFKDMEDSELSKILTRIIDPKRKTLLHLEDIPSDLELEITELFDDTKVKIDYGD